MLVKSEQLKVYLTMWTNSRRKFTDEAKHAMKGAGHERTIDRVSGECYLALQHTREGTSFAPAVGDGCTFLGRFSFIVLV